MSERKLLRVMQISWVIALVIWVIRYLQTDAPIYLALIAVEWLLVFLSLT